jgi:septum formation protein
LIRRTIILASASPRRSDLLKWAGVDFEIRPVDLDERRRAGESPADYAARLAREKALTDDHGSHLVLGADTFVVLGEKILDNPAGPAEARSHLADLSGRAHQVITAFCLAAAGRVLSARTVTSQVTFRSLNRAMIEGYAATGEGLDKAGAYGLQGQGWALIENVEGSLTNVMGLPLTEVLETLDQNRAYLDCGGQT